MYMKSQKSALFERESQSLIGTKNANVSVFEDPQSKKAVIGILISLLIDKIKEIVMAYFGVKDEIFQIVFIEDNTAAIFKLERWKIWLVFMLYTICSVTVISGQAMIIIYIGKYAPKNRAINRMILVDQVSNLKIYVIKQAIRQSYYTA